MSLDKKCTGTETSVIQELVSKVVKKNTVNDTKPLCNLFKM